MENVEDLKKRISDLEKENIQLKKDVEEQCGYHVLRIDEIEEHMKRAASLTNQLIDDLINLLTLIQKPKAIGTKINAVFDEESEEAKDLRSDFLSESGQFIDKSETIFTSMLTRLQEYRNKIYI